MNKNGINEATGASSSGKFRVPLVLAPQLWKDSELGPFNVPVYRYKNAELAYEEADNDYKESFKEREMIELKTDRIAEIDRYLKQFYTNQNDDEGSNIGEIDINDKIEEQLVKEDLAVWFGTKKKPKGSSQPKGPWVNICRKKEGGGHPPCGRPEATGKGYPKCRAAGVASKMTDAQKRAACSQKRKAEKSNPKAGTGNKPKMVSYKPRKESIDMIIKNILNEMFN